MNFFRNSGTSLAGHGSLRFNERVELIDQDGLVTLGLMNPGGGFWDAAQHEGEYDDDADVSLHLSENDDDDAAFLDALQDHMVENEMSDGGLGSMVDSFQQSSMYVAQ